MTSLIQVLALLAWMQVSVMAALPTSMPTSLPTVMPTVGTTSFAPSPPPGSPTFAPSFKPTWSPTVPVTDIPVGAPVIYFAVGLAFSGITQDTWNANAAKNNKVACQATTATLSLPVSACTVTNVTAASSRRLFEGKVLRSRRLVGSGVQVTTALSAPTSTSYNDYVSTMNTAISSGALTESVRTAAAAQGAASLVTAEVPTSSTVIVVTAPVTSTATAVPTPMPTSAPKEEELDTGAIVGIAVGGCVVLGLGAYFLMKGGSDKVAASAVA